jgi:hypothetical protein
LGLPCEKVPALMLAATARRGVRALACATRGDGGSNPPAAIDCRDADCIGDGASRGVRRSVAIGLANAGFKVFATGRNILTADLPADVVRIRCDHLRNEETIAAFARVAAEGGALDLFVNSIRHQRCGWT